MLKEADKIEAAIAAALDKGCVRGHRVRRHEKHWHGGNG